MSAESAEQHRESTSDHVGSRMAALEPVLSNLAVSPESAAALRNLARFTPAPSSIEFPPRRLAAVLILLHVDDTGSLAVTLTTRSMKLRSHPGDTAFPGGKFDDVDGTVETTALREANEEIGLPLDQMENLLHITTLFPFTSASLLVVVPVVYLWKTPDLSILSPNPDEVDAIFSASLEHFLGLDDSTSPVTHRHHDLTWLKDNLYRLHIFEHPTFPSIVSGLTADILITTSLIAYHGLSEEEEAAEEGTKSSTGRLGFDRRTSDQRSWKEILVAALQMEHNPRSVKDERTKN